MARKRWSEMSSAQRATIVMLTSVEVALTVTALVDLYRRPAEQVNGPKPLWALGCFVQPVGPIAYLAFGRAGTHQAG